MLLHTSSQLHALEHLQVGAFIVQIIRLFFAHHTLLLQRKVFHRQETRLRVGQEAME
jgi:hypothetical protein